jgi:branched-chain amino acid aminotransferase
LDIQIRRTTSSRIEAVEFDNLLFGVHFSDHMFMADYGHGTWHNPRIVPYGNIEIPPSLTTLHYGQAIFEGLKAFWTADGSVNVFRPETYHARMGRSCDRLCIPRVEFDLFISAIRELMKEDRCWVPTARGCSLYIRPFIFATDSFLGVRVSETYSFMIITSPVGAYYKEGMNPVSLITSGEYVRAVKGGLGEAKTPANYAASLLPAEEAKEKGYTQVLWLDGIENRYIEEVGTMNIMFVINGDLITPPLGGSVLAGITRQTVMELARNWGINLKEERISIEDVFAAAKNGTLQEVFGTGTAAVISPVGLIEHKGESITVNAGKIGPLAQKFYDEITGIQYGERPDKFGWCYKV